MGNCNFKTEKEKESSIAISRNMFLFNYVIGKGGFGKVWKVEMKSKKNYYALKEMAKSKIVAKRSERSVINERNLLVILKNKFIINMYYAFQDRENLYLVMDLLTGGDLRFHFAKRKRFSEKETQFFTACIVEGLDYIHSKGVIHRDIKPENLVFDANGYLKLTDFGIARVWRPDNAQDTSGTPGYMAPEVMCRQNHGIAADYFALGVIVYECMLGTRPYKGRSRKEIRDHILAKQVLVQKTELPPGWSPEVVDFINKLLQRKSSNRLGFNGVSEVKNHPWLKDISWTSLGEQRMKAPYIPSSSEDNFDAKYINDNKKENDEALEHAMALLRESDIQSQFIDYYYDYSNPAQVSTGDSSVKQVVSNPTKEDSRKKEEYLSSEAVHLEVLQ